MADNVEEKAVEAKVEKVQPNWTTIRLTLETKDMLIELGSKKDTYEDIIRRLLKK